MLRNKRYVDCPEHGTQEGHDGIVKGTRENYYHPIDPRLDQEVVWHRPRNQLFCPVCLTLLPYRVRQLKEGRTTETCGPLCWNAKKDLCNCICLGVCHGQGKCECGHGK